MAGRKPARTPVQSVLQTDRAEDVHSAIQDLQTRATRRPVSADLVIGTNRVRHELGRPPVGCSVTPTVASAAFAWAMTSADDLVAVIEVVGTDQTGATLEFY